MPMKFVFRFLLGWFVLFPSLAFSQAENDVIINEILNGSGYKDAVELLVVKPGGADLRGWAITDLNTPTTTPGNTEGYCVFPQNPFLQNVPQFTRIVLVFTKSTAVPSPIAQQDTIAADDSTLVLFSFGPDSLLVPFPAGSGVNLGNDDNVILLAHDTLTTAPVVDAVFYGTSVNTWPGAIWINNIANINSGQMAYFTNDSTDGLNNNNGASGKGWFSAIAESQHTLGKVNRNQMIGIKSIRIKNITRHPVQPNSARPVLISATVGSLNTLASVRTIYSYDALNDSADMSFVSDTTYQGLIPIIPKNKKVYYYIKATDINLNIAVSEVDSYTVVSSIQFASILHTPSSPDSSESVLVHAVVRSVNRLDTCSLFYTVKGKDSILTTDKITMNKTNDTTYQAVIPPYKTGDTVSYYISARDSAGQIEYSTLRTYIVRPPFVPISAIQADTAFYKGKIVSISGIIVIGDGKLSSWRQTYVVDRSSGVNGIQIYSPSISGDTLKRGDSVIVTGMISQYRSTTQIGAPTGGSLEITIVSRNNPLPPAVARTVTQISDIHREGEWVRIKGIVNSDSSAGGGENIVVEDATGTITVRIWNTTGVSTGAITVGSTYSFKGIVGLFLPSTQLLVAYNEDIIPDTSGSGDFDKIALKVSPHPFNPMAGEVFRYALRYGNDSRVIVRLYDLSGRFITTLVDQVRTGGRDETRDILDARTWNGRTTETRQLVPAGTYLLHLEVTNRRTGKSQYKTAPVVIGTKLR